MLERYTVFDVETPNGQNNALCAIAIIHVENRYPIFSKVYLVNPEARFDDINVNIHQITAQLVKDAPLFPAVWNEIKNYFTNGVVIAHNAKFDLSVIGKALTHYDIAAPDIHYICTLDKARRHIPQQQYGGHALSILCNAYQIELDQHHDAMCDTQACKNLFERLIERFDLDDNDIKTHQSHYENSLYEPDQSVLQKAMNTLYGVIFGIGYDRKITFEEHAAIYEWMDDYMGCSKFEAFNDCYTLLNDVLADGIITRIEYEQLITFIKVCSSSTLYSDSTLGMQLLMGIIKGIACDYKINLDETRQLQLWMTQHDYLKGNYPFDKIFSALDDVLADGMISTDEEQTMLEIFQRFLHPELCADIELDLNGKICCLTGTFTRGTKEDVESYIHSRGGNCDKTLTKAVNYLVVGGLGSEKWKFGNYGGKISKAVQMQEKGLAIQIVSEDRVYTF